MFESLISKVRGVSQLNASSSEFNEKQVQDCIKLSKQQHMIFLETPNTPNYVVPQMTRDRTLGPIEVNTI